jgi:hypothetical protein
MAQVVECLSCKFKPQNWGKKKKYIYMYIYTHTHIYLYMCVCVCVCVYIYISNYIKVELKNTTVCPLI